MKQRRVISKMVAPGTEGGSERHYSVSKICHLAGQKKGEVEMIRSHLGRGRMSYTAGSNRKLAERYGF